MDKLFDLILRAGTVDRRWIFLVIGLAVLLPLFFPLGLPIRATIATQKVYDAVEALEDNSKVLVSFEYGPSTKPEIHPMTIGLLKHLFTNGHQVYVTCLWPDGQFMAEEALTEVAEEEFNLSYGEDYVLLGFRPGNEAVVKGMVSNIRKLYTTDARGTLVNDIPIL